MSVGGVCCRVGGCTELERLELGKMRMRDGHKKANKIYPRSFNGVVVHGVCYRVHDGKVKNGGPCEDSGFVEKRMTRRTRREQDRQNHTCAGDGAKWWVVNKINNETSGCRK